MRISLVSSALVGALVLAAVPAMAANADDTGSVSGHVTAGAGAIVDVALWSGDGTEFAELSDDDIDSDGAYAFSGVPAGRYTVSFSDERDDDPFPTRFYSNVVTEDPADSRVAYFDVAATAVTGIDGTLDTADFSNPVTPTISGSRLFGKTLTVDEGSWIDDPDFDVQWFRGSSEIADATDEDYDITAADLGKSLHVEVTASEDGFNDLTVKSASVAIPLGAKVAGAKPKITGVAKVGKTVKAAPGTWKPSGVKFTYQWLLGKKLLAKATKSKLKLKASYAGKKISVVVTGGKVGVGATSKKSKSVTVVK